MKSDADYPALYRAANEASLSAQANYFLCIKIYAALALLGAALTSIGITSTYAAVIAAFVFLAGLFLTIFMVFRKFDSSWYKTRAVAESIKTSTWRFAMHAEPFDSTLSDFQAATTFTSLLRTILKDHKNLGEQFAGDFSDQTQLTQTMLSVRQSPLANRITTYSNDRIDEQRAWYAKKAKYNRDSGRRWFIGLVSCQAIAVALTVLRIVDPAWPIWPISVFLVAASSILGWTQGKRYSELAAAYGLTAHEIGLAKDEIIHIKTEEQFSQFVVDTELAFSREHTQWVARTK